MTPTDALVTVYEWLPFAVLLDCFVVGTLILLARRRLRRGAAARGAEETQTGTPGDLL